jgi:ABC-type phosphate transport system permease subunit
MKEANEALSILIANDIQLSLSASELQPKSDLGNRSATGETMAVLSQETNAAVIPHILAPVRNNPATIAAELGEAAKWRLHCSHICIVRPLFVIFGINMLVEMSY